MDGSSGDLIHNHAEHLIAELCANRRIRNATERPICFVAHSLGGLVVKRALIYSSEVRGNYIEHLRSVHVSTYGILFLGTPHLGADLTKWFSHLERMNCYVCNSQLQHTHALDLKLKGDFEALQNIDRQSILLIQRFRICFFHHDGKPTAISGEHYYVVEEESATPVIQDLERACIQQDHARMCQFENENTPGFSLVAESIQRYAAEAPPVIQRRWETEKAERQRSKEMAAKELLGFTESATAQKYTVDSAAHYFVMDHKRRELNASIGASIGAIVVLIAVTYDYVAYLRR